MQYGHIFSHIRSFSCTKRQPTFDAQKKVHSAKQLRIKHDKTYFLDCQKPLCFKSQADKHINQ